LNQAFSIESEYTPLPLTCTQIGVFDAVVYPDSNLTAPVGVRISNICGFFSLRFWLYSGYAEWIYSVRGSLCTNKDRRTCKWEFVRRRRRQSLWRQPTYGSRWSQLPRKSEWFSFPAQPQLVYQSGQSHRRTPEGFWSYGQCSPGHDASFSDCNSGGRQRVL